MFETTMKVEMRDEHWTLNIKTIEQWCGDREYLAYSERRGRFIPVSLILYNYLDRSRGFQREVEMGLDIAVAEYNQAQEDAHNDWRMEQRSGAI